jgi:parallel beta-helix repeat protein
VNGPLLSLIEASLVFVSLSNLWGQTTYYVDAAHGADANSGSSINNAWQSLDRVNRAVFNPGDAILLKRGSVWRESLIIPSSGVAGTPISFGAYGIGPNPLLNGSDVLLNWKNRGSNIWVTGAGGSKPNQLFFDGIRGIKVLAVDEINSSLEWSASPDSLYVYSQNNPTIDYLNPGIESSVRDYVIYDNNIRSFVVVDGIDVTKSNSFGILFSQVGSSDIAIQNLYTSLNFNSGVFFDVVNMTIKRVHAGRNGNSTLGHGIYAKGNNFLISGCLADNNAGAGIHAYLSGGGTVKNNTLCNNGTPGSDGWGLVIYAPQPNNSFRVFDNVIYSNLFHGLSVEYAGSADTVTLYNNVLYDNGATNIGGGISLLNNGQGSLVTAKNNICFENRYCDLFIGNSIGTYVLDHNLYFRSTGPMIRVDATEFLASDFPKYQAAALQDLHSLSKDPVLTNPAVHDFTLGPGSPCVDSGIDVGLSFDFNGISIPQGQGPDIGAYEYPALSAPKIESPQSGAVSSSTVSKVTWIPSSGAF